MCDKSPPKKSVEILQPLHGLSDSSSTQWSLQNADRVWIWWILLAPRASGQTSMRLFDELPPEDSALPFNSAAAVMRLIIWTHL